MSNPYAPYERRVLATVADPLSTELQHAFELDEAWDQGYATAVSDRRWRRLELILATTAGAVLGFMLAAAVVHAAPRSAETAIPTAPRAAVSTAEGTGPASGNPSRQTPVPPNGVGMAGPAPSSASDSASQGGAEPGAELGTAIESGLASFVRPGLGDRYLALPDGPGVRVRICSKPTRCLDRVSTDAGPDLAMQRDGRIADLSFADFAWLCRCDPWVRGLLVVSVERPAPAVTPPPTSTR